MPGSSIDTRIRNIQTWLGLEPDGIVGPDTLTAIERELYDGQRSPGTWSLVISRSGLDLLISHEITSRNVYNRRLKSPTWPGGESGVTLGIGYDLGYRKEAGFRSDWRKSLGESELNRLVRVLGLTGSDARARIAGLADIRIPYDAASRVFSESTLPSYSKKTRKAYRGIEHLHPYAQAAMLSLVYNRGASMAMKDSRREMRELRGLVEQQDYAGMAASISGMKRLWSGRGLDGLLRRRDDEAALVLAVDRRYDETDLIYV